MSGDVDTLMDLDYLEEPQLTFRVNNNLFTVPSYLNWVSNKPRPPDMEPIISGESSISSRRGTGKRSSLSRLSENGNMDLATQRLLFNEVDPKGRPPPSASVTNSPTDGGWAAITSVAGQGHKTSTEAVFVSNQAAARRLMTRSCYAAPGGDNTGGDVEDDEIDGPEIARLMRRFWPRDLNFFGGSGNASAGSRSLRDSRSSSTSAANRPTVLNLRGDGNDNRSAPDSFAGDFESPVELDWDHEPGAYAAPHRHSSFRGRGTVKSWYTSPFEDSLLDTSTSMTTNGAVGTSRPRNCRTLPFSVGKESVLMTQSACFSGQMVDSGFADP
ncbi:unnamed protein product [Hymenolepis diminuta]|nr:unnamed protein product [Hymenolepis diminuta]